MLDTNVAIEPALYLEQALVAVAENRPHAPIELVPGLYVRAEYILRAFAPEALARILANYPQSIRADVVERVRQLTRPVPSAA
jgi:hypothetical protein